MSNNYTKIVMLSLFFLSIHLSLLGQGTKVLSDKTGRWFRPHESPNLSPWQAHWIWADEALSADMVLARKKFKLKELPQKAQLRITASSQYQLFINGQYVRRGPARSAPHHQSFDILNIQDLLQKGKNIIAVRVHHQQKKFSHHFKGRAGLLVQLDMDKEGRNTTLISDKTWKVSPDLAWDSQAPVISRFQMVVNDRVDLRKQQKDWQSLNFDDSDWENAQPLMRKVGWPSVQKNASPQSLTPPWTALVPREVPYLLEKIEPVTNLIEAKFCEEDYLRPYKTNKEHQVISGILINGEMDKAIRKCLPKFKKQKEPLISPTSDNKSPYLFVFDLGTIKNGFLQLALEGSAGTVVDVIYTPHLLDNRFAHNVLDSDFRDQIILSGQKEVWEATYFKPARYVGIIIKDSTNPVKIHGVAMRSLHYPFQLKGSIHSTDAAWVNRYMEATAKTIEVTTTDAYTDNYRERRQYAQTGYYAALGNYWLFGDHALQRRYLVQVAEEQDASGIMPAYAPLGKDDYMVILDSNCLYIRSLRNYLLYYGDKKTVRHLLPAARKLMDLLHSFTNDLGMLYNPPFAYWLDHSQNDRRGTNFCLNGHYLGALEDFADILTWLKKEDTELFQTRATLLRQSLQTEFWEEEKGLFVDAWIDGEKSEQFSEHANAMALGMKIATKEQAQSIAQKILEPDDLNYINRASGMTMVTPAMSYFLHKGLCEYGYIDESFDLFRRRFDKMLQPQHNGTLWEEWWIKGTGRNGKSFTSAKSRSDAQTESCFPPALFGEYLLGVQPIQPGFEKVLISHQPSNLKDIEGQIPTPIGNLLVKWDKPKDGNSLNLTIPNGMEVDLDLESLILATKSPVTLNGKALSANQKSKRFLILGAGKQVVNY